MNWSTFSRTLSTLGLLFQLTAQPAQAGTIDTWTGPFDAVLATAGALVQGGTFVADDTNLAEISLAISSIDGAIGRAVVLATDVSGVPTGLPLWQGPEILWPVANIPFRTDGLAELRLEPNITVTPGELYFVGMDYGLYGVGVPGLTFGIGLKSGDPIPLGRAWRYIGGWNAVNFDIVTLIVMCSPTLLELHDDTVLDSQTHEACEIQAGPNYAVLGPNGNLTLKALKTVLEPDFWVGSDGRLTVENQ